MKGSFEELKEVCNKIVGHWYCDEIKQHYIFDFNDDKPLQMAGIRIITKTEDFKSEYGIGFDISGDPLDPKSRFYFDLGRFNKRYYKIDTITKDMLILREYFMVIDSKPLPPLIYKRPNTVAMADEILEGLG